MKKLIVMVISLASMYTASGQKYTDQYIKDASKVAEIWLSNIKDKKYENAFQMFSNKVKANYQEEIWTSQIIELMNEFGTLKSRIDYEKYFQSEVEGMENGFYVFINYKTDYEYTLEHEEYLILKQNDKMDWEIINYSYNFQNK